MTKVKMKQGLLRRMHRQRLSYIALLPSLITILNALSGFAAIVLTSKQNFSGAAWFVLLGMLADMLDGRIARMSKSTSSFGGQLDSLCDIVTFGVAPAFLMLSILDQRIEIISSVTLANFSTRFLWLVTATYVSCAAIRLARFNVENEEDESAHMSFVGLPTPAAAGVIVSIVLFHQKILPIWVEEIKPLAETDTELYNLLNNIVAGFDLAIIYSLPFIGFGLGILMVSRLRYPHIVNQYFKGKKPFTHLFRILLLLWLFIWSMEIFLVVTFCGFALSGVVRWFYMKVFRKSKSVETQNAQQSDEVESQGSQ